MVSRPLRTMLVITLVIGLIAGAASTSVATDHDGPTQLFFPWMPDGAMLGESGPYFGTLTIQNLESREIRIFPVPMSSLDDANPPLLQTYTLGPHASVTLSPSQVEIGDDVAGAGVMISAEFIDGGGPARIAGYQKQAAAQEPTSNARTRGEHLTVDGYTGLTSSEISTDIVLPIVQTNSGWNTVIRVTNFHDSATANTVRIALHEAGGATAPVVFTEVLGVGETETFDLLDRGILPGWVGSAVITSDADIGAVAERVKPATNMLIVNQSRPAARGGYLAPLVLREWNHWNTGISLVNLSDDPNDVTVDYFSLDGQLVDTDVITVPPQGMNFIFTPSGVGGSADESTGFVGSARISGTGPVHAAVDQIKYFGDDDDTGHAMSYIAEASFGNDEFLLAPYLLVPLVQKGDPDTGVGDTTGIQIVEVNGLEATVKIWFLDQLGNTVSPEPETIELGAHQGHTAYTMFYDYLPSGYQGSALIRATEGSVAAASNNVNYAVQYDGSASMNLTLADFLHYAAELELGAEPNSVAHFGRSSTVSARVIDNFGEPFPPGWAVEFSIADNSQVGFNLGPGSPYASFASVYTDESGTATVDIHLREEAVGDRPVDVEITVLFDDLEEQINVTWQAQPEFAPGS